MQTNMGTKINIDKVVSCRVTNSVIKYLESQGYDINPVIADLPRNILLTRITGLIMKPERLFAGVPPS
jgi:hypothetical protein